MVGVEPIVHCICINPKGEGATVDQKPDVLRPVGDGVKRLADDANMKGMVMIRSPLPQLIPFKPHRFGKQPHGNQIFWIFP